MLHCSWSVFLADSLDDKLRESWVWPELLREVINHSRPQTQTGRSTTVSGLKTYPSNHLYIHYSSLTKTRCSKLCFVFVCWNRMFSGLVSVARSRYSKGVSHVPWPDQPLPSAPVEILSRLPSSWASKSQAPRSLQSTLHTLHHIRWFCLCFLCGLSPVFPCKNSGSGEQPTMCFPRR